MSETSKAVLSLSTWNITANNQSNRVGEVAEYLARQEPGITILTELTAIRGLEKALIQELGSAYSLDTINTGGTRYEDNIGLLLTGQGSKILDEVEAVPTHGDKMRYIMRAHLATPLGEVNLIGLRGAYIAGKGTLLSSGSAERKAQYQTAANAANEGDGIPFVAGDLNAFARTADAIFMRNGLRRLTGTDVTWPDRAGLKVTTLDSRVMAAPFSLTHQGIALDAIYGDASVKSLQTSIDATGMSDHMHVKTVVAPAA